MSSEPKRYLHARYCSLLIFASFAAFGPVILINQPLWDDWVLRAYANAGTLWELYKQTGARELYLLVKPFASIDPNICTATELLLYALLGPLVYTIIRKTTPWSSTDAFWAALLTVLVPLNQARFVLSTLPYAFSCFFFALSIVLLLEDLKTPSISRRASIVLCLLIAFTTNSFLVLAWTMPLVVAITVWRNPSPVAYYDRALQTMRATLRRGELLLAPVIYWAAKKILEPTYGLYADYNKFQTGMAAALKQTIITFFDQFREASILLPALSDLPELAIAAAIAIAVFVVAALVWQLPLGTTGKRASAATPIADGFALAIGLALIISALFPYVLVGKPPRFSGLWETRHQTTLMLVSGFAIYSLLRISIPRPLLPLASAAIAAFFLVINIAVMHRLVVDALETREIAGLLKAQPSPPGTMMLVLEGDRAYRALGRFFPFYELSYMVNLEATGGSRIAVSNRELLDPSTSTYVTSAIPATVSRLTELCESFRSAPQYGFGGFVSNGKIETVKLVSNNEPPGLFETISKSIRSASEPAKMPAIMVRIERETSTIEGLCQSPCCSRG